MNKESIEKAKQMVLDIARVIEIGEVFEGTISRVEEYGCFVSLFGDKEGLCHVSTLANGYVKSAKDVVRVGETLKVKVIGFDDKGKIKLSHKEFAPKQEAKEGAKEEVKDEKKKKGFFRK